MCDTVQKDNVSREDFMITASSQDFISTKDNVKPRNWAPAKNPILWSVYARRLLFQSCKTQHNRQETPSTWRERWVVQSLGNLVSITELLNTDIGLKLKVLLDLKPLPLMCLCCFLGRVLVVCEANALFNHPHFVYNHVLLQTLLLWEKSLLKSPVWYLQTHGQLSSWDPSCKLGWKVTFILLSAVRSKLLSVVLQPVFCISCTHHTLIP